MTVRSQGADQRLLHRWCYRRCSIRGNPFVIPAAHWAFLLHPNQENSARPHPVPFRKAQTESQMEPETASISCHHATPSVHETNTHSANDIIYHLPVSSSTHSSIIKASWKWKSSETTSQKETHCHGRISWTQRISVTFWPQSEWKPIAQYVERRHRCSSQETRRKVDMWALKQTWNHA